MSLHFYKMTGSGNDFVFLDGRSSSASDWSAADIAAICDRRTGVGGDGLVVATPEGPDGVRMVYFNADGSRAGMCGNAALCTTRLAARLGIAPGGNAAPQRHRHPPDQSLLMARQLLLIGATGLVVPVAGPAPRGARGVHALLRRTAGRSAPGWHGHVVPPDALTGACPNHRR